MLEHWTACCMNVHVLQHIHLKWPYRVDSLHTLFLHRAFCWVQVLQWSGSTVSTSRPDAVLRFKEKAPVCCVALRLSSLKQKHRIKEESPEAESIFLYLKICSRLRLHVKYAA